MQKITDKQFILLFFINTIFKIVFIDEIERKFRENEVENFVKNPSKFAKILNKNKRISFNENFGGNPTFNLSKYQNY